MTRYASYERPLVSRLGSKTFAAVAPGDRRRAQRLIASAAQVAAQPALPFNQVFGWNDLRGFYRLCDQETATLPALQAPHGRQTHEEMARHPLVLIRHDATEMD